MASLGLSPRQLVRAVPVPAVVRAAVPAPVLSVVSAPVRAALGGPSRRRHAVVGQRVYIAVRGLHQPGTEPAGRAFERRLRAVAGVRDAELNAAVGRLVVDVAEGAVQIDDLLGVVHEVEHEHGLADAPFHGGEHPADSEVLLRDVGTAAAAAVALGVALAGRAVRMRRFPLVAPTLMALAEAVPPVRGRVEERLGPSLTRSLFAWGGTFSQTVAQRPLGLLVDTVHHASLAAETRARQQSWRRRAATLGAHRGVHRSDPLDLPPRPVPLPPGPVERYAGRVGPVALGAWGATLASTRNPYRALALLGAAVPRAARVGREAFAAQLGRSLAGRDAVVFDPEALRRLDRVDTVVLDSSALLTGDTVVEEVLAVTDGLDGDDLDGHDLDGHDLNARAYALVDPTRPRDRHVDGAWAVRPLAPEDAAALPVAVREDVAHRRRSGATVLAVTRADTLVGLAVLVAELDPLADALVRAAREVGMVVLAGTHSRIDRRLEVDEVVPGGNRLAASVRRLQGAGRGVALVSARGGAALAAADVGVGLVRPSGSVPWGAHVLCGPGLADAHLVLSAVPVARLVSRRGVQLSAAASTAAGVLAVTGPAATAPSRAVRPVTLSVAVALAGGTSYGLRLAHRPAPVPVDRTPWHALPVEATLRLLGSSRQGLSDAVASRRRPGPPTRVTSLAGRVARASAEELATPVTGVLVAGAAASALVGSAFDATLIASVLGVNAFVGGAQRLGTDRAVARLVETSVTRVRLRRSGHETVASAETLVPGDVVDLRAGDTVPADCRVIDADGLETDESGLTGESQPVPKTVTPTPAPAVADRHSMAYEGTSVTSGEGRAVVVATGERTQLGRTTRDVAEDHPRPSGVEERLRTLTRLTVPLSLASGAVLLGVTLARGRPLAQALGPAVNLVVAAVPEGLPFVATVAELAAARRLSGRGALVRNPSTMEALGRVDLLCFDKTGTLTEGRVRLHRVSDGVTDRRTDRLTPELAGVLAAALRATPGLDGGLPHLTDRAVVDAANEAGVSESDGAAGWRRLDEVHFASTRGYHAVLGSLGAARLALSVKGAPEVVLSRCERWRYAGSDVALDADRRTQVLATLDRLVRRGHRVLAVAERPASGAEDLADDHVRGLCLLGFVCLADVVRPAAAEAVARLRAAGVEVVTLTGDHPGTAEAIVSELDALNGRRVVTGPEIDAMDDAGLAAALPDVGVFARVTPAHKARIVRGLQSTGRVVAVTGDGANDAPAIRIADVGLALGSAATSAAREAADVVITDDRIETIADAILEGRAMWASVRDALAVLVGGNLGEIAFTLGSGLVSGASALNSRQLLLVNLLTDALPALAIAVRPPPGVTYEELAAEGPERSLGGALTRDVTVRAATTAGAAGVAWLVGRVSGTGRRADTIGLVALVGAQLGQTMAAGGRSPLVLGACAVSFAALGAAVSVPGVNTFFGCRPLGPVGWGIGLGAAAAATGATVLLTRRETGAVTALHEA